MSPASTQVGVGAYIADRYIVVDHLGGGSNGDVYYVRDEHLGNEVALKLLAPKAGQPATGTRRKYLNN
jgi:serine/threonine-protein kinase